MSGWERPNLIILPSILKVVITQKYTLLSVELRIKGRQVVWTMNRNDRIRMKEMTEKECHEMCKAVIKLFTKTIPKRVKKIKEEW